MKRKSAAEHSMSDEHIMTDEWEWECSVMHAVHSRNTDLLGELLKNANDQDLDFNLFIEEDVCESPLSLAIHDEKL